MDLGLGTHILGATRGTAFRVWAPRAQKVQLELPGIGERIAMSAQDGGVFACEAKEVGAGSDYAYVLDDATARPDPRSAHQSNGVHGPSRVVDAGQFLWSDAGFVCPELSAFVIYELHVGTFSAEGTFDAAIARLPYLVELGINAVEVMPIAQFAGARNWGYDGVFPYAPQDSYGGPSGFARFVDACHAHGLALILDVVYNHLGPEGNYLAEFGPYYTDRYKTAWGSAINFDGPDSDQVRSFFIDNALHWLRDYHVDALRLDAVHALYDWSARHILDELGDAVDAHAQRSGRHAYLIAESDLNDARIIRPAELGGYGIHSQWSDDFHHALRTLLLPARTGYLSDFGRIADLGRAFTQSFVYTGQYSAHRRRRHGNAALDRSGHQFVVYQQNHDQVGNTSGAQRVASLVGLEASKLAAAAVACAPNIPLLFMGEEFFAHTPFAYFVSHAEPDLLEAVRRGRAAEHGQYALGVESLDPTSAETFESSKLDWSCLPRAPHAQMLQLYKDLYALRAQHACLGQCDRSLTSATWNENEQWLLVERAANGGGLALCFFNFSTAIRWIALPIGSSGQAEHGHGPFRLALATSDTRYGGTGSNVPDSLHIPNDHAPESIAIGPTRAVIYLRQ